MREIKLTKGFVTKVDDSDYEYLSQFNWHTKIMDGVPYAARSEYLPEAWKNKAASTVRTQLMHVELMKSEMKQDVDHFNRDTLDNQRDNLRVCTRAQNCWNQKIRSTNSSGFKGVNLKAGNTIKMWCARLSFNNKRIHIGYYTTAEEAARAYDHKAKELFGKFARLNFA